MGLDGDDEPEPATGSLEALAAWLLNVDEQQIYDYGYAGVERCEICGRAKAEADCDPDPDLCWREICGQDISCQPGLRPAPPAEPVGPSCSSSSRPADVDLTSEDSQSRDKEPEDRGLKKP